MVLVIHKLKGKGARNTREQTEKLEMGTKMHKFF